MRGKMKKLLIVLTVFSFISAKVSSDVSAGIVFESVNTSGNSFELISMGGVEYETNHLSIGHNLFTDIKWSKAKGEELTHTINYGGGIDAGYVFNKWLKFYFLSTFESKESFDLYYRFDIGPGAKFTYIPRERVKASISLIPMYELERYYGTGQTDSLFRLSFRHKIVGEVVKDKLLIKNTTFYKPIFNRWDNFLLKNFHTLTFLITKYVNVSTTYLIDVETNKGYDIYFFKHKVIANVGFSF
jgi:hypothetical protein